MQTSVLPEARPVGRPLSPEALSILAYLDEESAAPARDIARALQLGPKMVDRILYRLVCGGRVEVIEARRLPGARRPVAVYRRAQRCLPALAPSWWGQASATI